MTCLISFGMDRWRLYLMGDRSHIHKRPLSFKSWLLYAGSEDRLLLVWFQRHQDESPLSSKFLVYVLYFPAVKLMFIFLPHFERALGRYLAMIGQSKFIPGALLSKAVSEHCIIGLLEHIFCSCLCISLQITLCCCIETGYFSNSFCFPRKH